MRITPAHAGTTLPASSRTLRSGDHPRSRGDHFDGAEMGRFRAGSPPLTRGPLDDTLGRDDAPGITPAHAGTTYRNLRRDGTQSDHPRSRGDHLRVIVVDDD